MEHLPAVGSEAEKREKMQTLIAGGTPPAVLGQIVAQYPSYYALPGLEPGRYTVVATALVPATSQVEVAAGPVTRVDLDLGTPTHERPRHAAPREG